MLSIVMNFVKQFLPDWPEWALDVLLVMAFLLALAGGLSRLYTPEEEKEEQQYVATHQPVNDEKAGEEAIDGAVSSAAEPLLREEKKTEDSAAVVVSDDGAVKGSGRGGEKKKKENSNKRLSWSSSADPDTHHKILQEFHSFRRQYIIVYLIIMLADWMQGTHMYTLYLSYGVNISALFLTGFLSGAIFAPFLGSFVDKFGRKRSCIVYCLLEIAINLMEGIDNFTVLIVGRILGGISTNLLFSAFESWMTTEHRRRGFPEEWLSRTYSQCSIGNGSMAIFAGIVAQVLEDWMGQIGPFHGAVALTTLALVLILNWEENYGEERGATTKAAAAAAADGAGGDDREMSQSAVWQQFTEGWKVTVSDSRIWRIGLTQALSEGAMYTFVFMWVPTLLSLDPPGGVPTGCVFSALMMAITAGGLLFPPLQAVISTLISKDSASELCASIVYSLASLSMFIPVLCLSSREGLGDYCQEMILASFLVVEFCVGLFMPVAGTLRSKYVPDALQGAILNIFRLPLNAVVVSGTYATEVLEAGLVFKLVSGCFFAAAVLQATMIGGGGATTGATKTRGIAITPKTTPGKKTN